MQLSCTRGHRSLLCSLGLMAVLPGLAWAQTKDASGLGLSFGIDQGIYWKDNKDLSIPSTGGQTVSRTKLSFGIVSETDTQRLAFDAQGSLEAGKDHENGLVLPSATLSYKRVAASTELDLNAFLRESEISALDFLETTNGLGAPVTVSVDGTGTRRQTGASAQLSFGVDAPFGGDFTLRETDTTYLGTTDPSLIDNTRSTAALTLRFDLSKVTTATVSLTASRLRDVGAAAKDSNSISVGLSQARPDGAYSVRLAAAHNQAGTRHTLRFGRDIDLPTGNLSMDFGVAHAISGKTLAVASLDWKQELALGSFEIGLSRDVTSNESDSETRISRLSMSYSRELSATLDFGLTAALQDSQSTATGLATKTTNISANLRKDLAQDWGMNFGATHRIRDKDTAGRADSSTVFLNLNRTFEFRP